MNTDLRTSLVVAACFVLSALVSLAFLGGWAPVSTAQIIDSDACERACYAQEAVCTDACGTHTNPVECDESCRDELEDCRRECR